MGFLDALSNATNSAYIALQKNAENVAAYQEEVAIYQEKFAYQSDEALFRGLNVGSRPARHACSLLLQERGYSREEVFSAFKRK